MYIEAIITGILIGYIRRGRLENFLTARFKGSYLALLSLLFFVIPFVLRFAGILPNGKMAILPFLSVVVCLIIATINYRKIGMKLLILGLLLNLFVMGLNDFRMPVDTDSLDQQIVNSMESGEIVNYTKLAGTQKISYILGKVIRTPDFYPIKHLISIGDIISNLAIILIIQDSMVISRRGQMMQFRFTPNYRK